MLVPPDEVKERARPPQTRAATLKRLHSVKGRRNASGQYVACRSCDGDKIERIGDIPAGYEFAGRVLRPPLPGGALYRCRECELWFRHPVVEQNVLNRLYIDGAPDTWQSDPSRRVDWSLAKGIIRSCNGIRTILDVGCFDGGFLHQLGGRYTRDGIEIHPMARQVAERREISIVGYTLSDLEKLPGKYDCVTAIDMIEHVSDPKRFLALLTEVIRPGGVIIVSTGNSLARSWRIMGAMYWYCAIPEHIAFINPSWCRRAASQLGLDIVHMRHFSHEPLPLPASLAQAAANVLYGYAPGFAFGLRRIYAKTLGKPPQPWHSQPPPWRCAKDHFITVFRK
jgi:2-polyprenyl-3-methyl-5-hydroxy-6-metoxy-1,4-benzoquinol methylase